MLKPFWIILKQDLISTTRMKSSWVEPLVFFTIIIILFPLSLLGSQNQIAAFGPSMIWIGVLLSGFLSLSRLLQADYENGVLDQMLIASTPLPLLLLAKVLAYWIAYGLPLVLIAPIYGTLLFLPAQSVWLTGLALLLGTLITSLIGLIGTALTVSLPRSDILIGLLVMPLYLPAIIFGTQITTESMMALPVLAYFAVLGAMLLPLIVLSPFFAAIALKIMLD